MANRPVGDTVDVIARFRNIADELTSPSSVTCTVKDPDGSTRNPTASEISAGVFHIPIEILQAGNAYYRVEGTGNDIAAVAEGKLCGVESSVD